MRRLMPALALIVLVVSSVESQPAPPAVDDAFLIVPGQRIGRVRLGTQVKEVTTILGAPKATEANRDRSITLRWYGPENEGIGVRATRTGAVYRIWVLNDPRYATRERLRAGSTEGDVRTALGKPTRVDVDQSEGDRSLEYDSLGIEFTINLDPRYDYYNSVYEITVNKRR